MKIMLVLCVFSVILSCGGAPPSPDSSTKEEMTPPHHPSYLPSFLMGLFDPVHHKDFIEIDQKYADQAGRRMHILAYAAFEKMWESAKLDNVNLTIVSATRNFDYQKGIWERKWTGKTLLEGRLDARTIEEESSRAREILRFSAMPGASRHHWGTDIDLNALNNAYFEQGKGLKVYEWLESNASKFGFFRPYTAKGDSTRSTGYEEEKWHWSYLPLARTMLKDAQQQLSDDLFANFSGSQTACDLRIVQNYILGVDRSCLPQDPTRHDK